MWLLLIAGLLVPIGVIGYCIFRLDKFFEKGGFQNEGENEYPVAIVLGSTRLSRETSDLLLKNSIQVFPLTEPFLIEQGCNFNYLFALSERDADNIVICKICRKVYSIDKMISICSDRLNEGMFKNEGIRYIKSSEATARKLFLLVTGRSEVGISG